MDLRSNSRRIPQFFYRIRVPGRDAQLLLTKELSNYVPAEFEVFMDNQIKEWVQNGALEEWDKVREPGDPFIPVVVSPFGVEPSKP